MDNRRDTLKPQVTDLQTEGSWIPATPIKAGVAEPRPICTDNLENQPCQANWLEAERFSEGSQVGRSSWLELDRFATGFSQDTQAHGAAACCSTNSIDVKWGVESWEEAEATKSSLYGDNVDIYSKFLMDTANKWSNIPFADLLALADAATATSAHENKSIEADVSVRSSSFGSIRNSHIEDGRSISSRPPFDLNLRPKTTRDAVLGKSISSQFVPVTPDQTKRVDKNQVSGMPNLDVEKRKNQATDEQDNEVATKRVEVNELYHEKDQSQMPTDQSCGAVCTELQENHNPDKAGDEDMDLRKTAQQKPRRKRHRPKVVIEGQPKRSRKPRTPKPAGPEGTPTGKRKYVRKNGLKKTPTTPPAAEETGRTTEPRRVGRNTNSCRRSFNFDFESQLREESSSCRPHSNLESESHAQNFCTRVQSTVNLEHGMGVGVEKTKVGITCNLTHSINQVPDGYLSVPEKQAPSTSTPSKLDPLHDKLMDDAATSPNESNCSSSTCLAEGKRARGLKRERSSSIDEAALCSVNAIGVHYKSFQAYLATLPVHEYNGRIPGMHFPEIYKKKRTGKGNNSATSGKLSTVNHVRRTMAYPVKGAHADPFTSETNGGYSAAQFSASSAQTKIAAENGPQDKQHTFQCMLPNTERSKRKRTKGPTRVRDLASLIAMVKRIKWLASRTKEATSGVMQEFKISQAPHTCMEALSADTRATLATKKRTKRKSLTSSVPPNIHNYHEFLNKSIGSSMGIICKDIYSIDGLVERFRHLDINTECNLVAYLEQNALIPYNTRYQEQNALVLYQRDGTVVRFEGSSVKKRWPRPKVELDDETNRVWKLLLQDINSEGIDGTDEDKAKWWEEERRVFRGRADSFIARMHLIQGDRRFSKWKGSVLDSVVGVFLTQNVSDHLSSSAFMSLAARFPLKSKSTHGSAHEERTSILVKEPQVCVLDPNDTIGWHEDKSNQPASDQSSMTVQDEEKEVFNTNESFGSSTDGNGSKDYSTCKLLDFSKNDLGMYHESAVNRSVAQITGTVASFIGDHRELDDVISSQHSVISSQNSLESSVAKTAERIGSCSQSNSEAELIVGSKLNSFGGSASFVELLRMAGTTMLRGVYNQEKGNITTSRKVGHNQLESMACDSQKQDKDRFEGPQAYLGHVIPSGNHQLHKVPEVECFDMLGDESRYCGIPKQDEEKCASQQSGLSAESVSNDTVQNPTTVSPQEAPKSSSENDHPCNNHQAEANKIFQSQTPEDPTNNLKSQTQENNCKVQSGHVPNFSGDTLDVAESTSITDNSSKNEHKAGESNLNDHANLLPKTLNGTNVDSSKTKRVRSGKEKQNAIDWDSLRKQAQANGKRTERTANTMDSLDWEAVRCADVNEIAYTIRERGMNNMLAERIKAFLNRIVREHGSIDLEWLRDVPPDKAKEYLLSVRGLGLKSVECVRLLTLHHLAFPVDTNVGRIAVRLGWVPIQPLPESLQLHLLELYPVLESIQKYLWPRLCKLDQRTLYELHYQMITFGKVFCTKNKPNCNACPMRGECRHFASAFASARLALPAPEDKSIVSTTENEAADQSLMGIINRLQLPPPHTNPQFEAHSQSSNCEPIIEVPATPEPIIEILATPEPIIEVPATPEPIIEVPATPEPIVEVPATPEPEWTQISESDIEDTFCEDPEDIPTIKLNIEEFTQNLQNYMQWNMELRESDMSKALVALTPEGTSIPTPRLKNVSRLRTEHQVYELPDSHPLLEGLDKREPDDPCLYLLAIWTPGETADSIQPPGRCISQESDKQCDEKTCFSCNSIREANSQTVRGTLLIPCRTAMRGSFPLNGTYFQVNEVFADHESSLNPIAVPRAWIWNLPRRTVYFGTSIPTIFKGLSTEGIQYCFWRGFVCVRGFDQKTRSPRPLMARLHFPASKLIRAKGKTSEN